MTQKDSLMEKTLEQLIQEAIDKSKELEDVEQQILEVVRPGTILKLKQPLYINFNTRIDQDLTEDDFTCAVVVSVPGHGFSLMDIEGHLIRTSDMDEEEHNCGLWYSDPITLLKNFPGMIVGHISDHMVRFIKGKR